MPLSIKDGKSSSMASTPLQTYIALNSGGQWPQQKGQPRALTSVASHGVTDKSDRAGAVRASECWEMETQQCLAGWRAFPWLFSAFPQMPHRWHPMQCHSPRTTSSWAVATQLYLSPLNTKCLNFYTKPNSFPPKKLVSIKTFHFIQN